MKYLTTYKREYVKFYNLVIDVTKATKDFLYPGQYTFSRIDSSLPIGKQLTLIRKDLESMKFKKEVDDELMRLLTMFYPIYPEEIDEKELDNIQLYLNPVLKNAKKKLENRYFSVIKSIEIDDYKDTTNKIYSDEEAWVEILKDKNNIIVMEKIIERVLGCLVNEANQEYIDGIIQKQYQLDDIEFNRYLKGDNNTYSSIRRAEEVDDKIEVDFKKFNEIFKDIFGQDMAIEKIKKTLVRNIMFYNADDIENERRKSNGPLATFMFYGPTGTGKTQTAKKIAEFVYNDENKLLILDMNSYKDAKLSTSAIKGHPEGYLDSAKGTDFTRFLKKNRNGIIVLDEFEKSSVEVRELFMTMLDEGKFKDALGNVYDLSGYIFVATTNVSRIFENRTSKIGFASPETFFKEEEETIKNELRNLFTAPIMNRFNEVIGFNEIKRDDAVLICEDLIDKMIRNIQRKKFMGITPKIKIEDMDEIVSIILEKSNFKKDGVRSLKNVISDVLGTPILEEIINKNNNIVMIVKNDKICVDDKVKTSNYSDNNKR